MLNIRRLWRAMFPGPASRLHDPSASLANRDLRGLILAGIDLNGRDLSGANLTAVPMNGARLRAANLRGACLAHVDLRNADLTAADLTDADLRGADLRGAITDGVRLGRRGAFLAVLDARAFRGLDLPEDTPDWLLRRAGLLVRGREMGVLGGPSPEALARLEAMERLRAGLLEALFALNGRPGAALDSWDVLDRLWHRARLGEDRAAEIAAELDRFEQALDRMREGARRARTALSELGAQRTRSDEANSESRASGKSQHRA